MFMGSEKRRRRRDEFDKHKNAALAHLASTPIRSGNYQPLITILLWWMGVRVKPPHFQSFPANILTSGAYFAIVWGVLMWFILFSPRDASGVAVMQLSVLVGLIYGVIMAFYYRLSARRHNLPDWHSLK